MSTETVAVVTGASRGIGREVALELGRRGATVVVTSRTVEPHRRLPGSISRTSEEITAAGGKAIMVQADLSDPRAADTIIDRTVELTGRVDVLVNNAADTSYRWLPLAGISREEWEKQFTINLHAPFSLIQAAVPVMEQGGGGVIVNVTSNAAALTPPHDSAESATPGVGLAYASSKAALNRLGNALAPELRAKSIAIVSVDPGLVRTELADMLIRSGKVKDIGAAPPAQIATAIADLGLKGTAMEYTGQIIELQR